MQLQNKPFRDRGENKSYDQRSQSEQHKYAKISPRKIVIYIYCHLQISTKIIKIFNLSAFDCIVIHNFPFIQLSPLEQQIDVIYCAKGSICSRRSKATVLSRIQNSATQSYVPKPNKCDKQNIIVNKIHKQLKQKVAFENVSDIGNFQFFSIFICLFQT